MLYSKTVSEIDLETRSIITTDGSRLYATGNRFFLPGDIVYTDGTYAYGLQKRRGGEGIWGGGGYCLYYDPSYGGLVTIDVRTFRVKLLCRTPYIYFVGAENGAYAYTEGFRKLFNLVTGEEIPQDLRGDNQNENYIRDHYAVDDACISDTGDLLEISAVRERDKDGVYKSDGVGIFKNGKLVKYESCGKYAGVINPRIYKDGTYMYTFDGGVVNKEYKTIVSSSTYLTLIPPGDDVPYPGDTYSSQFPVYIVEREGEYIIDENAIPFPRVKQITPDFLRLVDKTDELQSAQDGDLKPFENYKLRYDKGINYETTVSETVLKKRDKSLEVITLSTDVCSSQYDYINTIQYDEGGNKGKKIKTANGDEYIVYNIEEIKNHIYKLHSYSIDNLHYVTFLKIADLPVYEPRLDHHDISTKTFPFEYQIGESLKGTPIMMSVDGDKQTIDQFGLSFKGFPTIAAAAQNTYIITGYVTEQKEIKGIKVHLLDPHLCECNFRFARCSGPMLEKIKATAHNLWGEK